MFRRVETNFAKLHSEYQMRKNSSEALVIEWRWYTWCWFDIRPLHFERNGWAPGRRLGKIPAHPSGSVENGFDAQGRVVVERQFNEFGYYETFYDWTSELAEVAHFDYWTDKTPINLMLVQWENGKVRASYESAIHGYKHEEYCWNRSVVRMVKVKHGRREKGVLLPVRPLHDAKIDYDDANRVERVTLIWPPSAPDQSKTIKEVMYERRGGKIYRPRA